ncbi:MAG: LURP-one-related family protein [Clostridia bacterium]
MQIKIKRKLLSIPVRYEVKNEETDEKIYKAKGKMFSITGKVFIKTIDGAKLMLIKHKLFKILPQFCVYDNNKNLLFILNRKFSIKNSFNITDSPDNIEIHGEVFGMEWSYLKNGVNIATIKKELINLTSVYHVNVVDENEAPLVVATIIAIDRCFSKNDNNSFN